MNEQSSKRRLDTSLVSRGIVKTRSQAESYIKLSKVKVDGLVITKSGYLVTNSSVIELAEDIQYVGRAALKLRSICELFKIDFRGQKVLDVGSSTGGFTDYALRHGAVKVIAIELGSDQLHPSLRGNPAIELHEKTDILSMQPFGSHSPGISLSFVPNLVVIDLSFVSLRNILPHILKLVGPDTELIVLVKPQFEARESGLKHKGVIKNERIRRDIFKDFESWVSRDFVVLNKADSKVAGSKGNVERFYLLCKSS